MPDDIGRISEYSSESIIQLEYPNQLNKKGRVSDYSDTLRRHKAANGMVSDQKYDVKIICKQKLKPWWKACGKGK